MSESWTRTLSDTRTRTVLFALQRFPAHDVARFTHPFLIHVSVLNVRSYGNMEVPLSWHEWLAFGAVAKHYHLHGRRLEERAKKEEYRKVQYRCAWDAQMYSCLKSRVPLLICDNYINSDISSMSSANERPNLFITRN